MEFAGAVVVWSGKSPRLETFRIGGGFELGRALVGDSDDRVSAKHARFTVSGSQIVVEDLKSRNGTAVGGRKLTAPQRAYPPAIVRTGNTISVLVPDVRPYERIRITKRGTLTVAGSLDAVVRGVETAAIEEENFAIVGPWSIARELATEYALKLGGAHVVIDSSTMKVSVENALHLAKPPRTIILILGRPFTADDTAAMETWLETDVRVVSCARFDGQILALPASVAKRLAPRVFVIPRMRFDELPTTIVELAQSLKPRLRLHPTAIETALLYAGSLDEDVLLERLRIAIDRCTEETLRGDDLARFLEVTVSF